MELAPPPLAGIRSDPIAVAIEVQWAPGPILEDQPRPEFLMMISP
jgi:hypothetical protein